MSTPDFDFYDLLNGALGLNLDEGKPRRSDFDVPLPADCKAWLRRITKKHREAGESA